MDKWALRLYQKKSVNNYRLEAEIVTELRSFIYIFLWNLASFRKVCDPVDSYLSPVEGRFCGYDYKSLLSVPQAF